MINHNLYRERYMAIDKEVMYEAIDKVASKEPDGNKVVEILKQDTLFNGCRISYAGGFICVRGIRHPDLAVTYCIDHE